VGNHALDRYIGIFGKRQGEIVKQAGKYYQEK
jgi:hypothetical protein